MIKKILLSALVLTIYLSLNAQVQGVIISDTNNYKLVKIWGTHEERGYAYGSLLGDDITEIFNNYLILQFGSYYSFARDIVENGQDLHFDSLYIVEAKAIINGMSDQGTNTTDMDYIDILVCNSFLDISNLLGKSFNMGCSSLISWGDATTGTDLNGGSVISRHLDWTINSYITNNQVICVSFPDESDEQPWVSVGFAGMVSVLSGFNADVGVFQHMMNDFSGSALHNQQYEPVWYSLRNSIEKFDYNGDGVNNVQDVRSKLMDQPAGFADGFIISTMSKSSDYDTLVAMIAETAPTAPTLTFRYNTYPDSIPGDNLYTANYQIARNNAMNFGTRYNAIKEAIGTGTDISLNTNWELMRDYSHLSHNIQFMEYSPEADTFKISVYKDGSAAYHHDPDYYSISDLLTIFVGTDEISGDTFTVNYSPNPVKDVLNIYTEAVNPIFDIFNTKGKIVNIQTVKSTPQRYQLQFESVPSGLYIINVYSAGKISTIKVIKE